MKIGERIFLIIFILIVIFFLVIVILFLFNIFDVDIIQVVVYNYMNIFIYVIILLFLIIMGFLVMFIGVKKKKVRFGIIYINEFGNFLILLKIFELVGYNVVKDIKGIKDVLIEIEFDESGVIYYIDVIVINDVNVFELIKEV